MPKTYDVDGIIVDVINPNLGSGAQGHAEQVALSHDQSIGLVVKHIPMTPEARKRVEHIVNLSLPALSPYLAAPIAANLKGTDEIIHLAPLAIGDDPLTDSRTLPEQMETAFQFACLTTLLEEQGLAHGDLAPTNMMISSKGELYLIDFDNLIPNDPKIPPATMAGHDEMMAPELREGGNGKPSIETDRFTYGVMYNIFLLRRHPAGDTQTRAETLNAMTSGLWPERHHKHEAGDIPIEALGTKLGHLFDATFSLNPKERPSADAWRRAVGEALQNMVIHDCANAFVYDEHTTHCPFCADLVSQKLTPNLCALRISLPSQKTKYRLDLEDGKMMTLGRANLGTSLSMVSGRHLEITPMGQRLFLRHVGRNPTQILRNGKWYKLDKTWIDVGEIAQAPITMKLADVHIDLSIST